MTDRLHEGALCQDLSWREWVSILDLGRRVVVDGQSWLETSCAHEECTAVFLSGCVGLRPIPEDVYDGREIILRTAPAIIDLSNADDPSAEHWAGHWIVEPASVHFYTHDRLQKAFEKSPRFASNFVHLLNSQSRFAIRLLSRSDSGLRRLSISLLSRVEDGATSSQKLVVTQSQLAIETGLSRQWVNRLLRQLERQGIAEMRRGHLLLHTPAALRNAAGQVNGRSLSPGHPL